MILAWSYIEPSPCPPTDSGWMGSESQPTTSQPSLLCVYVLKPALRPICLYVPQASRCAAESLAVLIPMGRRYCRYNASGLRALLLAAMLGESYPPSATAELRLTCILRYFQGSVFCTGMPWLIMVSHIPNRSPLIKLPPA